MSYDDMTFGQDLKNNMKSLKSSGGFLSSRFDRVSHLQSPEGGHQYDEKSFRYLTRGNRLPVDYPYGTHDSDLKKSRIDEIFEQNCASNAFYTTREVSTKKPDYSSKRVEEMIQEWKIDKHKAEVLAEAKSSTCWKRSKYFVTQDSDGKSVVTVKLNQKESKFKKIKVIKEPVEITTSESEDTEDSEEIDVKLHQSESKKNRKVDWKSDLDQDDIKICPIDFPFLKIPLKASIFYKFFEYKPFEVKPFIIPPFRDDYKLSKIEPFQFHHHNLEIFAKSVPVQDNSTQTLLEYKGTKALEKPKSKVKVFPISRNGQNQNFESYPTRIRSSQIKTSARIRSKNRKVDDAHLIKSNQIKTNQVRIRSKNRKFVVEPPLVKEKTHQVRKSSGQKMCKITKEIENFEDRKIQSWHYLNGEMDEFLKEYSNSLQSIGISPRPIIQDFKNLKNKS